MVAEVEEVEEVVEEVEEAPVAPGVGTYTDIVNVNCCIATDVAAFRKEVLPFVLPFVASSSPPCFWVVESLSFN